MLHTSQSNNLSVNSNGYIDDAIYHPADKEWMDSEHCTVRLIVGHVTAILYISSPIHGCPSNSH